MKKIIYLLVLVLSIYFTMPTTASASDWKYVSAGQSYQKAGKYELAIEQYKKALTISKKASTYRSLGESYEKLGKLQNAADTYYLEAAVRQQSGDIQSALATKQRADNLNSEVQVFAEYTKAPAMSLAKYEPSTGMYFGAFLEQDPLYESMNSTLGNKYEDFNTLVGKDHSTFYVYHRYGQPFPFAIAERVKEAGGALQIAMEPHNGLAEVNNKDGYLKQFKQAAKESGIPIFMRFASEMNGDWVKWGENPKLYIEKFQLVAKELSTEDSNIAMVWAPNSMPSATIHDYYPGDAYVDWIGMNVYSNPYNNGNYNLSTKEVNPLTFLDTVYDKYPNKPMMIAEFGASHYSIASGIREDQTQFGVTKMRLFYEGLRLKYPRVKAVHWFSVDTLTSNLVNDGRRINNFSLTSNKTVLNAYKNIVKHPYYLSHVENGPFAQQVDAGAAMMDLHNATVRPDDMLQISSYVKTYDPFNSKVQYHLNGAVLGESTVFPYTMEIPASKLKATNTLKVTVYDSKGKVATSKTISFKRGAEVNDLTSDQIRLFLNDKLAYDENGATQLAVAPFSVNGRTLVPIRFISENLGSTVNYQPSTKKITVKKGNVTLEMTIGAKTGRLNGKQVLFDAAPIIQNGTTFVPIRIVSDSLNVKINYTASTQAIDIIK